MSEDPNTYQELLSHTTHLREATLRLREKIAAISRCTENSKVISEDERECLLNVLDLVRTKGDEMVYAEDQFRKVINCLENMYGNTTMESFTASVSKHEDERVGI